MNNIVSGILKNLKQIGQETVEIAAKNTGEMTSSVITGRALVGDLKPMTNEQMSQAQKEEVKKQQEVEKIKQEYMGAGRNVEQEVEEVRRDREKKEKEEEQFLLNIERQRMAETREREQMQGGVPTNSKKEAAKHQGQRGHKKHAPDPVAMSATGEKSGGID
ncbi:MAG: hypothetical protein WC069_00935 [Candidatus Shapirobacteria bacterium]